MQGTFSATTSKLCPSATLSKILKFGNDYTQFRVDKINKKLILELIRLESNNFLTPKSGIILYLRCVGKFYLTLY